MKQTILITGSSGFIGSNLVDELLALDYKIVGVSKSYPLKTKNLKQFQHKNYLPIIEDITAFDKLNDVFQEHSPEIVVHLAAQAIVGESISSPVQTYETNIEGTWNVLEIARKTSSVKKVIVASSDKAYGEHSQLPYKEDFSLNAIHPYDISKKITEELAMSFFTTYNVPVIITRCGNAFGPYDLNFSRIVPSTIQSCLSNKDIILRRNGKQTRCYIYIKDIVSAYMSLILSPIEKIKGQVFNFGNEDAVSVINLADKIKTLAGNKSSKIIINNNADLEISNQSLDSTKAKEQLNWAPKYSLEKALSETIEWYKTSYSDLR